MTQQAHEHKTPYFPIDKEPPISTLDRPLIVESAFPGWLSPAVNPHIPYQTDAVAREIIASVRQGAATIHVHPRDPVTGKMVIDPLMLKHTQDLVFAECPDIFTANHSWWGPPGEPITYIDHTRELLEMGNGPRYIEGSVVLLCGNPTSRGEPLFGDFQAVAEGVAWMEEHGVKPLFQLYDTHSVEALLREIIAPGLAKWQPFMCVLHMGKHESTYIGRDPWAHLQLFTSLQTLRTALPDAIIGLRAGGRNWLPITVSAMTMGIDMVSVGMEDALWMYPHRQEIMAKNAEVIRKVVTIARELGRPIATSADVRRMLNTEKVAALSRFAGKASGPLQ